MSQAVLPFGTKYEFFLHWWGGCAPAVQDKLGYPNIMYFDSKAKRDGTLANLQMFSAYGLAFEVKDGFMTHTRPVATVTLRYKGREYTITDDTYSLEYEDDSVRYMWQDGNTSCDCNRSIRLRNEGHDHIPELECGNTIELLKLEIARVPGV